MTDKFNFKFWPPFPDAINGKEFAEQIEKGINDVGALADDSYDNSAQALVVANSALQTATSAVNTANTALANSQQAINTASNAEQSAAQAVADSAAAQQTANQAFDQSVNAIDISNAASQDAAQAVAQSTSAVQTANAASQDAAQAVAQSAAAAELATEAINIASGYYVTHDEVVDADAQSGNAEKYFLTNTGNTNFPVGMPVFFEVNIDDNNLHVLQTVTSAADAQVYKRTASIDEDGIATWGEWKQGGGGSGGGIYVGKMEYTGYSPDELADALPGWYFMNGDAFDLASVQGAALNSLPSDFKTRWGITVSGSNISLPSMFYSDGRGYYIRAGDGTTKLIGAVDLDQMQGHRHAKSSNIQGGSSVFGVSAGGNAYYGDNVNVLDPITDGINGTPRTGSETRGLTVHMTPIIYLGA